MTEHEPAEGGPKRAVLVVNSKSRRGSDAFEEAKRRLAHHGIELEYARDFKRISDLKAEVRAAIYRKAPLIVAGGGDGTFSAIARYFVDSESTLGVLPLGTGNAFARDLGIAPVVETACDVIAKGKPFHVDLGYAGNDYFLNVATIGLTTKIAEALTGHMKKRLGMFVYAAAVIKALATVQPFHVHLETENGVDEYETLLFVLGNGRYHAGPFRLSPSASITEGKLSLYALATSRKAAFLRFATRLVTGHQGDLPEVRAQDTAGGVVTTTPAMPVTVDGEISLQTPMRFRVAPKALRVIVPQEFEG